MGIIKIQDIKQMEKNIQNNLYKNKDQFINDMKKIFGNARIYNQPETIYYKGKKYRNQLLSSQKMQFSHISTI